MRRRVRSLFALLRHEATCVSHTGCICYRSLPNRWAFGSTGSKMKAYLLLWKSARATPAAESCPIPPNTGASLPQEQQPPYRLKQRAPDATEAASKERQRLQKNEKLKKREKHDEQEQREEQEEQEQQVATKEGEAEDEPANENENGQEAAPGRTRTMRNTITPTGRRRASKGDGQGRR